MEMNFFFPFFDFILDLTWLFFFLSLGPRRYRQAGLSLRTEGLRTIRKPTRI
jgi:hypothetical protein